MIKKFFTFMMAAGVLLATSCSHDDLDTVQSGNEAQVTFSLSLEGGFATRAISDGSQADKLVYAVFDENGGRISTIQKIERTDVTFPATETLTLAKGQTYKIAFWAQDADCEAYTIDDNMNVTVSYENASNNDETRDAFFKTETFTVTGSTSIHVELKRPFAQINVGVTEEDWEAAVASGVTIKNSSVVIKNAATSINLLTGAVSGSEVVTHSLNTIPTEDLKVDVNGDGTIGNDETYTWLSMSYILVNDGGEDNASVDGAQKATLESLEFTFQPESGNEITLKSGLTNVPVQRNWRTNILGKLLTSDIIFNISIDPIYDGDYIYPDGSAQELAMAAAYGGTITLQENVVLQEPLKIAAGKSVVINLNGKRITPPTGADRTIQVFDGAELVINGEGTIGSLSGGALAVCVLGGKLTINGGTYNGGSECSCIYLFNSAQNGVQNKGSIEINGGTFKVKAPWNNFYYVLNQQNGAEGTITVKGGTFENYDPSKGDDHDQPTNFVAEGYASVKTKNTTPYGTYQVVKIAENADEAKAAIGKPNGIVVVASNMTASSWSIAKGSSKLILNNNAVLSGDTKSPQSILLGPNKTLTIDGEGTIVGPKYDKPTGNRATLWLNGGSVAINGNVFVKNGGGNPGNTVDAGIMVFKGKVNIYSGYFYAANDATGAPNPCIHLAGDSYNGTCVLNVYGGVFESETETNNYLINVQDSKSAATWNKIAIYGGIFVGFNPANGDSGTNISTFVADGYESVQTTYNGKTAWEVKKIGE